MASAVEHSEIVLAAILKGRRDLLERASTQLTPEHFPERVHASLFGLMVRFSDHTGGAVMPLKFLGDALRGRVDPGQAQLFSETYEALAEAPVADDSEFAWSLEQLRELAAEKATGEALTEAMEILKRGKTIDHETVIGHEAARLRVLEAFQEIDHSLVRQDAPEGDMREEGTDLMSDYAQRKHDRLRGVSQGVRFGIDVLDRKIGGLQPGELVLAAGYSSDGKAVGLSCPLLTPRGEVLMRDVQIGTELLGTSGDVVRVTGVYPQGVRKIFRLTFSDGTSAEATEDHLWAMKRRMPQRLTPGSRHQTNVEVERTYTTAEMVPMLKWKSLRPYLPDIAPVAYVGDLTAEDVDPYLVGLLLGDGGLGGKTLIFTSADAELVEAVRRLIPVGSELIYKNRHDYRIRGTSLRSALQRSGVGLTLSHEKLIPDRYLHASSADRISLLQGLLDTDGWADKSGGARFVSVSRKLAEGVAFLARSLGIRASLIEKGERNYLKDGERVGCREAFEVAIGYHPKLFRLERKRAKLRPSRRVRRRVLVSIEYVRDEEAQCISVDAENKLYLLTDFIPTHNTTLCTQAAWSAAVEQGKNVVFLTTETLRPQVRRKLLSRHSRLPIFELPEGLNTRDLKGGTLSDAEERDLQRVVDDLTKNPAYGRLYVAQVPRAAGVASIEQRLYRIQRKFNIDFVVMDYIALLISERRRNTIREEMSGVLKDSKLLATSFDNGRGIPFMSPWQVSRAARESAENLGMYSSAAMSETAEATNSPDVIVSLLAPSDNTDRYADVTMQILKNRDGETANGLIVEVDYATSCFRSKRLMVDDFRGGSGSLAGGDSALDQLLSD